VRSRSAYLFLLLSENVSSVTATFPGFLGDFSACGIRIAPRQNEPVILAMANRQETRLTQTLECGAQSGQEELRHALRGGSQETLNDLFTSCMPRLLWVADCILHNYHDSEDALQDSLLSALRHLDQFRGNAQFSTWLHSIVRNAALARLRRQRGRVDVPIREQAADEDTDEGWAEAIVHSGPDPERACAQSELSLIFAKILDDLPANYRAIIRLCDFEGFSGKEAAERLGLTVSALKAQHHRARLAIRESLKTQAATNCW
jgi:RNA polymerase sigma-70 factor (ECF subfamily)